MDEAHEKGGVCLCGCKGWKRGTGGENVNKWEGKVVRLMEKLGDL